MKKRTLRYGSADGGEKVLTNQAIAPLMKKAAEVLHIADHKVKQSGVMIAGPGDIGNLFFPLTIEYLIDLFFVMY